MSGNVSNHIWVADATLPLGGKWVRQTGTSGGAASIDQAAFQTKIVESGGFTYIARAPTGTAESSAGWQVKRVDSFGSTLYADGDTNFDNLATSDAVIIALTYSYT